MINANTVNLVVQAVHLAYEHGISAIVNRHNEYVATVYPRPGDKVLYTFEESNGEFKGYGCV